MPSELCDVKWATQNCSLSFDTIGVWPENADGTDINAVCKNSDSTLLCSGDDFGKVKLYLYPTIQPKVCAICFPFLSFNFKINPRA